MATLANVASRVATGENCGPDWPIFLGEVPWARKDVFAVVAMGPERGPGYAPGSPPYLPPTRSPLGD